MIEINNGIVTIQDNDVYIISDECTFKIDITTAKKIAETIDNSDSFDPDERVTDIAEMETEPYNDGIDPAWYREYLEDLNAADAALMVSTYVNDYDSDLECFIDQGEHNAFKIHIFNMKTFESGDVYWLPDETFRISFKERLLAVLRKVSS